MERESGGGCVSDRGGMEESSWVLRPVAVAVAGAVRELGGLQLLETIARAGRPLSSLQPRRRRSRDSPRRESDFCW